MNKSACVWEKNKEYYITNLKNCDDCGEPFKQIAVVSWIDKEIKFLHIDCNKKYRQFRRIKASILASVVTERPKGAVFVGKPFDSLTDSKQLDNYLIQDGVKIIDKTKHAGRESFEGACIGVISKENKLLDEEIKLLENKEGKK